MIPVWLMPSLHCVNKTIANSYMVPAKVQGHLHTKHVDCKDKYLMFLKCKCDELKKSESSLASVTKDENVGKAL
jgi:hypothetical protein